MDRSSLSMGISRQAYWSGFPFPSPGTRCGKGKNQAESPLGVNSVSRDVHVLSHLTHSMRPMR